MVTAELAVALPALTLVLAMAVYAVAGVTAQLRCTAAAATAARLAGRGEPPALVTSQARLTAPSGARVIVSRAAQTVTATVSARLRFGGLPLPGITVQDSVVAPREADAAEGQP